jgi:hypothetical protein
VGIITLLYHFTIALPLQCITVHESGLLRIGPEDLGLLLVYIDTWAAWRWRRGRGSSPVQSRSAPS